MTERKNPSSDNSNSSKLLNDSVKSQKEDFFKINQNFVETGIQNSFKTLNSNIYNVINSSFSNINNDYEKKLEVNREIHEKAIVAFNSDLQNLKETLQKKKTKLEDNYREIFEKLNILRRFNLVSKVFNRFLSNYQNKKLKKSKNQYAEKICEFKKKRNIFSCWRNITNIMFKSRTKLKYSKLYNEKRKEIEIFYMGEINKYLEILKTIEDDIKKEIEERKTLNKLYDIHMTEGAERFIKETKNIIDFNSSSN
jgi:hypothetical protein